MSTDVRARLFNEHSFILHTPDEAPTHSELWHAARAGGLGSSDAPVVLGVDPWKGPYDLWAEKRGEAERIEQNEAMEFGNEFKQPIARIWSRRTGRDLHPSPGTVVNLDLDWLRANYDAMTGGPTGATGGVPVEVKNVTAYKADQWDGINGIMPPAYTAQLIHQCAVARFTEIHCAAAIGGNKLEMLTLHPPEQLVWDLIEQEAEFWRRIQTGQAPDWTDNIHDARHVARWQAQTDKVWEPAGTELDEVKALLEEAAAHKLEASQLRAAMKEAEDRQRLAQGAVQARMGDAEAVVADGRVLATWKRYQKKEYVVKATTAATFTIKKTIDPEDTP